MAEPKDLQDVLPKELFNRLDGFKIETFELWEKTVASPGLESQGFSVGPWVTTDEDSFGPLIREVILTKDNAAETYFYGYVSAKVGDKIWLK